MLFGLLSAMIFVLPTAVFAAESLSAESVIDAFSGSQNELLTKLNAEAWQNSHELFDELARSSSYRETDLLTNRLLQGSSTSARLALLEGIETNRANYANFLVALSKKAQSDPQALARMAASLDQTKAALKARSIPFPTPDRCATWVMAYVGVRSFFFSLRGYWGADEDEMVDAAFEPVAENGTNLAMMGAGLTCLAEFVIRRNELPQAIMAWQKKNLNKRQLSELAGLVENLRHDPSLLKRARELKALSQLDEMSKALLLQKHAAEASSIRTAKIARESETALLLEEMRRTYASEGRMKEAIKNYFSSLSPATKAKLGQAWENSPGNPGSVAELEAVQLEEAIRKDFRAWIQTRGKTGQPELIDELLRQETEVVPALENKLRSRALTAKVCMGMLAGGGGVALYGHMASIGSEPTPIDRPEDEFLRKYHDEIWGGLAVAGSSACFLHVGMGPIYRYRIKKQLKNSALYLDEKEWAQMRKMAAEESLAARISPAEAAERMKTIYGKETVAVEELVNRATKLATIDRAPRKRGIAGACQIVFSAFEQTLAGATNAPSSSKRSRR